MYSSPGRGQECTPLAPREVGDRIQGAHHAERDEYIGLFYQETRPLVNPIDDNLTAAIQRNGMELTTARIAILEQYCRLLWEWNAKLNLTRHTDFDKFVARDLADSQAFSQFLQPGETVLDVGTGGGVPGVVLAVLRDDLQLSLCESVGKKARAVSDIVARLGLSIPVHHARAEAVLAEHSYTTLVIRAVARLAKLLAWFAPCWDHFERMLVLKGPAWVEERGEARHHGLFHGLDLRRLMSYPLPDTESESVLLEIRKRS
jgi:16S rRNA (guanine527-N7)-methyltransferase